MKVILDTNVLISGIIWKGTPRRVLELWSEGAFQPFVSLEIIAEYQRVLSELSKKYPDTSEDAMRLLNTYIKSCVVVGFQASGKSISRDKDDDKILLSAESSGASYLVSGDKDLLVLKQYKMTKIVKPKVFVDMF